MTQPHIVLRRGARLWMAQLHSPHDAEAIDMLGTDTLPTTFGIDTDPRYVVRYLRINFPGYRVLAVCA